MLPDAEKIVLVLEGIGDDKIRVSWRPNSLLDEYELASSAWAFDQLRCPSAYGGRDEEALQSRRPTEQKATAQGSDRLHPGVPLRLPDKRRTCRQEFLLLRRVDFRVAKVEVFHRFHDRGGDDEPSEPLVVRRHDEPRRVL
jgi:hypothetical protein